MASHSPSLLNQSQGRNDDERERALAQRSSIQATEGFVLGSRDWRALEAQLTAFFANDADFAKISLLGSHSYFLSHVLGTPVDLNRPDSEIEADLNALKKHPKYHMCKAVNLAVPYGMGPFLLAEHLGITFQDAVGFLQVHERMAPKVTAWKAQVRIQAHKEHYLRNPWGWISPYYWHVFTQNSAGEWVANGKQANQCLSFLPQSSGACMIKDVWLTLDEMTRDDPDFFLLIPVHDEILFECRLGTEVKYHALVRREMERKWVELGGLSIATEGALGLNWAKAGDDNVDGMKAYHDPP
jgi:DNA polymerase-1